ncbi:MAG TPA: serine/threonine-protein kinase, partial [Polyangiaceae bacterium]
DANQMSTSWSRRIARLPPDSSAAVSESASRIEANSAPEPSPYLAGEVIGDRYRLVRELGRGGMGVVWVGHALALGVEVAVKLIRASIAGPAIASRMAREAHAAARLGHPALVRVFDFGWTSRGDPYLVMELVQGETLSALLEREGHISAIRAVQMLLPVADGLRLAHDRTIVHRDIKPDNIFMATDPLGRVQPKLLDFGIAKVGPGNNDGRLTQIGVVLGSPEYMSPEQALGADDVDERTDVWSLSVVLYEMVTGNVPHQKANYNALMQAIIHDEPQPMTEFPGGDASLWELVRRGLAKDRDLRWQSMAELGEVLALWLYEHGIKEDICGNSIRAVWIDGPTSTVRVEAIATEPPPTQSIAVKKQRFSSTAQTVERRRDALRLWYALLGAGQRRVVVLGAAGLGAIFGGLVAASFMRGNSVPVAAAVRPEDASSVTSAAPSPALRAIEVSLPASGSSVESLEGPPTTSPSAAPAAPFNRSINTANSKSRANASANINRSSSKSTKKRRDFGF